MKVLEYNTVDHFYLPGLPRWLNGKESTCQCRDADLTPGLERFPGEGNDSPLQYSCLENPMAEEPGGL